MLELRIALPLLAVVSASLGIVLIGAQPIGTLPSTALAAFGLVVFASVNVASALIRLAMLPDPRLSAGINISLLITTVLM